MPKLRAHNLSVSLDGYLAGPEQSLDAPMGQGNPHAMHQWAFQTSLWDGTGASAVDERFAAASLENIGAGIMGRNMFGPVRGPWPDESWRGWWEENPPYHHDIFVLTHHPRPDLVMAGGTTFHFVDGSDLRAVLDRAFEAAGGQDVRLNGGASTVRQFLEAGLVDELHVAITPVLLGRGERLLPEWDGLREQYEVATFDGQPGVLHAVLTRRAA